MTHLASAHKCPATPPPLLVLLKLICFGRDTILSKTSYAPISPAWTSMTCIISGHQSHCLGLAYGLPQGFHLVCEISTFERRKRTKAWNPSGCEGPGPGTLPLVFLVHHGSQGSLALAGETYAQCPLPKSYWDISVFQYSSICVSTSKEINIPQKY